MCHYRHILLLSFWGCTLTIQIYEASVHIYYLFILHVLEGLVNKIACHIVIFVVRKLAEIVEFVYRMFFSVGKQVCDFLDSLFQSVLRCEIFLVVYTHVAMGTVLGVGLAEVPQQLSAAANGVVAGIVYDRLYASGKFLLASVVYLLGDDEVTSIDAVFGVCDERYVFSGYEVDDGSSAQLLQYRVYRMLVHVGLLCHERLVYVDIFHKQGAVASQQGCYDLLIVGR